MHDRPTLSYRAGNLCKNGARWLLLATLVYAPLAFGCTRPEYKEILMFSLLAVLAFYLGDCLLRLRRPRLPWAAVVFPWAILAYGWLMVLNARQEFDPDLYRFFDLVPLFKYLPGTVDQATARPHMLLITGLIGAFWVAGDAASNPRWRNRLWLTICLTGLAVMVFGLRARLANVDRTWLKTSFATYPYHANAGAFINLVLPFIAYRAIAVVNGTSSSMAKAFWCLAALITAACGYINFSKAGAVITTLLLATIGLQQIIVHSHRRRSRGHVLLTAGFILGLVAVLGWAFGLDRARDRWMEIAMQITPDNTRLLVYKSIWTEALPVSGWWGFGPGTFQITFPFFCHHVGDEIKGIWRYAHEDYLQTILEWGWVGASLWAVLIFGGLARWANLRAPATSMSAEARSVAFLENAAFFSLAGICLHALIDFPFQIASLALYGTVCLGLLWGKKPTRICASEP